MSKDQIRKELPTLIDDELIILFEKQSEDYIMQTFRKNKFMIRPLIMEAQYKNSHNLPEYIEKLEKYKKSLENSIPIMRGYLTTISNYKNNQNQQNNTFYKKNIEKTFASLAIYTSYNYQELLRNCINNKYICNNIENALNEHIDKFDDAIRQINNIIRINSQQPEEGGKRKPKSKRKTTKKSKTIK